MGQLWLSGSQLEYILDAELKKRATTASAAMKRGAELTGNVMSRIITLFASDGPGAEEADGGQKLVSQLEECLNGGIDEGARVATECLRDWGKRAFALVGLLKEEGEQGKGERGEKG